MVKLVLLTLAAVAQGDDNARALSLFSLSHQSAENIGEFLPIEPGTRWVFEHERVEEVGPEADTVRSRWIEEVRVVGQRSFAGGLLILREGAVSAIQVDYGPRGDPHYADRIRRELSSSQPTHLFARDGYVWEVAAAELDRFVENPSVDERTPEFFFPLSLGVRWSNPSRETADLEATRRFLSGEGGAPNPGMYYWIVEGQEQLSTPLGDLDVFRLVYRTVGGPVTVWFSEGVGIVRETFVHSGSYWEQSVVLQSFAPVEADQ